MSLALFVVASCAGTVTSARGTHDSLITAYGEYFPSELPEKVRLTVSRIPDFSRRFLAVSYYLRRADEITEGWSWTSDEVEEYRKTEEYDSMVAQVHRVQSIFAERNAGYSLRVTIGARSLGTQIRKWNSVSSVSRAANDFLDSAEAFLDRIVLPDSTGTITVPPEQWLDSFRLFLQTYSPLEGRVPTVAVPGLSKHGQLRAFDFKVYRGGRMIAGARSATIATAWDAAGWTEKLFEAAVAASPHFVGPLPLPYEPWHYNYDPDRDENAPPLTLPGPAGEAGEGDSSESEG